MGINFFTPVSPWQWSLRIYPLSVRLHLVSLAQCNFNAVGVVHSRYRQAVPRYNTIYILLFLSIIFTINTSHPYPRWLSLGHCHLSKFRGNSTYTLVFSWQLVNHCFPTVKCFLNYIRSNFHYVTIKSSTSPYCSHAARCNCPPPPKISQLIQPAALS